ncbi:hypothetical protein [Streptomyces calvus]
MNEEREPLTAEERRLMLRVLASLRHGLAHEVEDRDPCAADDRPRSREMSERLRERNLWSRHREGLW